MICGHSPRKPWRNRPRECSELCVHEILNGPLRQQSLDKQFACLVLCWHCNGMVTNKKDWPEARQLAVLKAKRPDRYDLAAFNTLANPRAPNRLLESEVDAWSQSTAI